MTWTDFKPDGWHTVTPRVFTDDVAVLDEFLELGAVEDTDARLRRSPCAEQQRLEMELVDAVAPLRAGLVAVGALLAADAAGARRQLDARQLRPDHRHAHCYVIAIFRRQPGVADPVGVALDVRRLAGSVTVTSTPREASSIASVSPTGPAPTINTLVSNERSIICLRRGLWHHS